MQTLFYNFDIFLQIFSFSAQNDSKTIRGLGNKKIFQMLDRRSHQGRNLRGSGFGSNRAVACLRYGNGQGGDCENTNRGDRKSVV